MAYFSFRYALNNVNFNFSFNLGSKFLLKLFPIFLNICVLLIHYTILHHNFTIFNLTLILGGIMTAT